MPIKATQKDAGRRCRRNERGAALISVLLISSLLLSAGGALILTTSLSATNSVDATAEAQAYYAAEAGLQAALNVLRGNVGPTTLAGIPSALGSLVGGLTGSGLPGGGTLGSWLPLPILINDNDITFLGAVTGVISNAPGDLFSPNPGDATRLSRWLPYTYTPPGATSPDRVVVSNPSNPGAYSPVNGLAYSVRISDPDKKYLIAPLDVLKQPQPDRLMVESTGYGPRGAQKRLVLIISRYALDIETPATVVIRGSDVHSEAMTFSIGNSSAKKYSGHDRVLIGGEGQKSAFAVSRHDTGVVEAAYKPGGGGLLPTDDPTVDDPKLRVLAEPGVNPAPYEAVRSPWFLETADAARSFVASAKVVAAGYNRVLPSLTGMAGAANKPVITFVNGDCTLDGGAGLLVVTGKLTLRGNPKFDGIILVLGGGVVERTGGGDGNMYGSIMIAKFGSTGGFGAPTFTTSGGGNSTLQYDSRAIETARALGGYPVIGVVEK